MRRGDKDGPTHVPGHTTYVMPKTICATCRYLDSYTDGNVCGGFGGRVGPTVYRCRHPDAMHYYDQSRLVNEGQLDLQTSDRGVPREIARSSLFTRDGVMTPTWCPYLKEKTDG